MDRYQTPEMAEVWDERARNGAERALWIEVMRLQGESGVPIPPEALDAYRDAAGDVPDDELEQIAAIERETRHDVYARLLYFNRLAGHEYAHWGMTSADIIENVQQAQTLQAAEILLGHAEQVTSRLLLLAEHESGRAMVARTHGQPAQITTLGKRAADWAVELILGAGALARAAEAYQPRGLKGAVGTRADMAALLHRHFPGRPGIGAAQALDAALTDDEALVSTGQCYPRGADLPIVSASLQVAAACATVATNVRLLTLLGHAAELPTDSQIGSSAMPHKANPRYSERVCGLLVVARGYASMLEQIAGGMWFEGDVSTSSVRRVALPGLFHTVDAMLANTAYVLDRLQFDREAIAADVRRWRTPLASGRILEACVAAGADRSAAHERIRRHAANAAAAGVSITMLGALADDPEIPLSYREVEDLVTQATDVGPAESIAMQVVAQAPPELRGGYDETWPHELL